MGQETVVSVVRNNLGIIRVHPGGPEAFGQCTHVLRRKKPIARDADEEHTGTHQA